MQNLDAQSSRWPVAAYHSQEAAFWYNEFLNQNLKPWSLKFTMIINDTTVRKKSCGFASKLNEDQRYLCYFINAALFSY